MASKDMPSTSKDIPSTSKEDSHRDSDSVTTDHSNRSRRGCVTCNRLVLTSNDPHESCINCLGPSHSMLDCVVCQAFTPSYKLFRARRLAHWQHEQTRICPSNSVVKAKSKQII